MATLNQIKKAKEKLAKQEKDRIFRRAQAYIAVVAILPALIDDFEELDDEFIPKSITKDLKHIIELLIEQDELFLSGADTSVMEHKIVIQRMFRQWLNSVFVDELKR